MQTAEANSKLEATTDEVLPPVLPRKDGNQVDGPLQMVRNLNELFDSGEKDEISFMRGVLRCLGHCAIGTDLESVPLGEEVPAVNPWKLMGAIAKAGVSKEQRRDMIKRISEGMRIGDSMGLLATLDIYGGWKRAGLSPEEAKKRAWGFYGKLGNSRFKKPH